MGKQLKPEIMSPSESHPSELDYSKIGNGKPTPTIKSVSPEYPKYRDALIIASVILLLLVFMGGVYFLTRHKGWSVRKLYQQRRYSETEISTYPAPKGLVNDFANVIPQSYEKRIVGITDELLKKTEIPVVVVTMPDIGGADYNVYAVDLYNKWGIGKKGVDKGVLLFITIKERKVRIVTGSGIEGILPDSLCTEILHRNIIPSLKQNKYGEGLLNGTIAFGEVIADHAGVKLIF